MKRIGRTTENKILVELSEAEFNMIINAESALRGKTKLVDLYADHYLPRDVIEIGPIFRALYCWVSGNLFINDIQDLINQLRENMGIKESPGDLETCEHGRRRGECYVEVCSYNRYVTTDNNTQ